MVDGFLLPRRVTYEETGDGRPDSLPDMECVFEIREGALECVSLHLDVPRFGRAVTNEDLGRLDLDALASQVFTRCASKPMPGGGFASPVFSGDEAETALLRSRMSKGSLYSVSERRQIDDLGALETVRDSLKKRAREKRPRDADLLRAVAQVYMEDTSGRPTETVRRWLGADTTRRTAERRLTDARVAGLLPRYGAEPADYLAALRALDQKPGQRTMTLAEAKAWADDRRTGKHGRGGSL